MVHVRRVVDMRDTHPWTRRLAWLFPLLKTGVVIATGNHSVLDVVGIVLALGTASWR